MKIIQVTNDIESIQRLATLAKRVWFEYFPSLIGENQTVYMVDKFQSEKAFTDQLNNDFKYIVATEDGVWKAYSGYKFDEKGLFISKLYTTDEVRGKGVGSQLLNHLIEQAKKEKVSVLHLTVNKYNEIAINFYKRKGFVVTKEAVFDIGNGYVMDDYIMELTL